MIKDSLTDVEIQVRNRILNRYCMRAWRRRNPDRVKELERLNSRGVLAKERQRRWRKKNRKRLNNALRIWRATHKEQWNVLMARAKRKRYHRSLHHKFKDLIGSRIYKALKKSGTCKSVRTESLLGCSIPFLRQWLESKFVSGMNWSNMGKFGWHIDHKVPCASFDLSDPEQQKTCFHYTNLQPLWWRDNLTKGCTVLN